MLLPFRQLLFPPLLAHHMHGALSAPGASLKQLLSGRPSAPLCDAAAELAHEATTHLLAARALAPDLSPQARALLQPSVVTATTSLRPSCGSRSGCGCALRTPRSLGTRRSAPFNYAMSGGEYVLSLIASPSLLLLWDGGDHFVLADSVTHAEESRRL